MTTEKLKQQVIDYIDKNMDLFLNKKDRSELNNIRNKYIYKDINKSEYKKDVKKLTKKVYNKKLINSL